MTSSSCEEHGNICIGGLYPENSPMTGADSRMVPSAAKEQVPELESDGTPANMISNGRESCTSGSISRATTTASDLSEDEDYQENGYTAANGHTATEEKLTVDWFIPSDASFKRSLIRMLIYDLLNASSQNVAPTFCDNEKLSSGYRENENEQKLAVEFLNHCFSPSKTAFDNTVCSVVDSKSKSDCLTFYNVVTDFEKQEGEAMHKSVEPETKSVLSPEPPCQKLKCAASQTEEHADVSKLYISSSL